MNEAKKRHEEKEKKSEEFRADEFASPTKDYNGFAEELDSPYTQDLGNSGTETSDELGIPMESLSEKKKEKIRPGDILSYESPIFFSGDKRGKRKATVLSVDPHRDPVLTLDNGEVLSTDVQVRRDQTLRYGVSFRFGFRRMLPNAVFILTLTPSSILSKIEIHCAFWNL